MAAIEPNTSISVAHRVPRSAPGKLALLAGIACAALCPAVSAAAYTPQVYDASKDVGQDFTKVPANTAWNASGGINRKIWSNIWGNSFWFSGSTGLWITSSAAAKWPTTGMMQSATGCSAGFGYGDFHWRAAVGDVHQGPGANMIMWPADNDPGWPGIIKNSDDNHIGEVDVFETNYGSNGTIYSTLHFYNGGAPGHNGQIIHSPDTFPTGNMTTMHDYDEVWGPGSLVLKIDGVVQMSAPPTQVRADYAHGGCNYTLGAQMAMQATAYDHTPNDWVEIADMWWSATDQSAGGGTSVPIGAPSPTPAPPAPANLTLSLTAPANVVAGTAGTLTVMSNYTLSAATIQEKNNGVTTTVPVTLVKGGFTVPYPATLTAGTDVMQVIDGATAASNQVSVHVASPAPAPAPTPPAPAPTPVSSAALKIMSVAYSGSTVTGTVMQAVAGGVNVMIDGKYAGVERDNNPVGGPWHFAYTFSSGSQVKRPGAGTHSVTYYLKGKQDTTSATASFTIP